MNTESRIEPAVLHYLGLAGVCWWAALLLSPGPLQAGQVPVVHAVSVRDAGLPAAIGAHGYSGAPTYSGDGRSLLFFSDAADLSSTPARIGIANAWVRDRVSGIVSPVSVTPDGLPGANGDTSTASISFNGRRIAFASVAGNLVTNDANGISDVFVRDLDRGETRRISVGSAGADADGASFDPDISADGNSVVFRSFAGNLTSTSAGSNTGIYQALLDRGELRRIDVRPDGSVPNAGASLALQNTNGTVVVIRSAATDLVTPSAGRYTDLYVHREGSLVLQPVVIPGIPSDPTRPVHAYNVCLSRDGRYLAFRTGSETSNTLSHEGVWWFDLGSTANAHASGVLASVNDGHDDGSGPDMSEDGSTLVFQVWTASGSDSLLQPSLRIWNASAGLHLMSDLGVGDGVPRDPATATDPVISADGTRVAYWSAEAHPVAGVTNSGAVRLYVRTLASGDTRVISRPPLAAGEMASVEFRPDARSIAFEAPLLSEDPGPAPRRQDVFEAVIENGRTELISAGRANSSRLGNLGATFTPGHGGISDDGTRVLFLSNSDDLVPGDSNGLPDAFVRDLNSGRTWIASAGADGQPDKAGVRGAVLSGDGRSVAFVSTSRAIQAGDQNPSTKVFVRNLDTGVTVLASAPNRQAVGGLSAALNPVISRDGTRVMFDYVGSDLPTENVAQGFRNLYVRDLPTSTTILVNRTDVEQGLLSGNSVMGFSSLSSDGTVVVFLAGPSSLRATAYAFLIDSNRLIRLGNPGIFGAARQVAISGDGRRVALSYVREGFGVAELSVRDLDSGVERVLVSVGYPSILQPSPLSELLISRDGSRVFFRSTVDPIHAGTPRGGSGLYASRADTAALQRLDSNSTETEVHGYGDTLSVSADGRFAAFRSRASDMAPGDINRVSDVFVKDLTYGTTRLLSISPATGYSGSQLSSQPVISADGSRVAFLSFADDLVSGDFNQLPDVFVATVPQWLTLEARRIDGARGGAGELELRWAVPLGTSVQVQRGTQVGADTVWTVALAPSAGGEGVETSRVVDGGIEHTRRIGISETNTFFRLAPSAPR